jgi:hypothetical protein
MATSTPADGYDRFYKEKLWELIPSIHRHEDGIAEAPGTLRAFVELIAEQAALLRRSQDRLWDDAFIDLCDDWAVPYIGDLVATRMVSALNKRGRRVDVAKTIYYRRRKGTPRVLEELIADITGWDGKVVESFRFLGRCRHRLDPARPDLVEPAVGWADLRLPRLAELTNSAWDPFAHTPDLRRPRGGDGRWNIPAVSFHLFRLAAVPLHGVQPHARADGTSFTFDPSGRDTQLFMPRHRGPDFAWDTWTSAKPWEVPAPMGCRILGHAEYVIDEALRQSMLAAGVSLPAVQELAPLVGVRFVSEAALREYIATLQNALELLLPGNWDRLRAGALVEDCGKHALWPEAVVVTPTPGTPIRRERMSAGDLAAWDPPGSDFDLVVDPVRGRFVLAGALLDPASIRVDYTVGTGGPIGAGGQDRRATVADVPDIVVPALVIANAHLPVDPVTLRVDGITEIPTSATYAVTAVPSSIEALVIQAANFERPYIVIDADWIFTAASGIEATLVLDGLWIGSRNDAAIVLAGAWHEVTIRSSTLDPGGLDADGNPLTPVRIFVDGKIDRLVVERSVIASIATQNAGVIDDIVIHDAIVDAQGDPAITLAPGGVELRRVTVLGELDVERLDASDTIVTGNVDVTDTQAGCFRFSAAPEGSRLPHPYRRVVWSDVAIFGSTLFGAPDYAWLAESAPDSIRRGAENGGEMGAWNAQLVPIKEDSLHRKVDEYLPFGLIPTFIRET